jgi:hypothetical protein
MTTSLHLVSEPVSKAEATVTPPESDEDLASFVYIHGTCRKCNHWFNKQKMPCPLPGGQRFDLTCPKCQTPLFRIGTQSSQESFMTQETISVPTRCPSVDVDSIQSILFDISGNIGSRAASASRGRRSISEADLSEELDDSQGKGCLAPPNDKLNGLHGPAGLLTPAAASPASRKESYDHQPNELSGEQLDGDLRDARLQGNTSSGWRGEIQINENSAEQTKSPRSSSIVTCTRLEDNHATPTHPDHRISRTGIRLPKSKYGRTESAGFSSSVILLPDSPRQYPKCGQNLGWVV